MCRGVSVFFSQVAYFVCVCVCVHSIWVCLTLIEIKVMNAVTLPFLCIAVDCGCSQGYTIVINHSFGMTHRERVKQSVIHVESMGMTRIGVRDLLRRGHFSL